ncbi:oocyte zinc finger protein XlCOF8.4-like isoform X13 [Hippocampus zosterae]|uniref:oocyte zinc finger protein XlCOF8.4-like isoform X13 n=1 Tax=Hippocampus zosterae TaxID=109293 RepID=UPI00223DDFF9|nr:oocyte zinc finger protein XlCOF8.4-like isoform X13 [Hippocampus zosterae]
MCSRTSEYEEELCGEKEDHKGQRQPLDAIGRMQPRVLHRLDISKDVCPERLGAEPSHIKEEEEKKEVSYLKEQQEQQAHYIKEEELEYPCTKAEVEEPRDISKDVCPERLDADSSHIKEKEEKKEISHLKEEVEQQAQYIKEQELQNRCTKVEVDDPPDIKEEDDEEVICKVPFTGVLQKTINKADREAPSTTSCQHMTTKGVGNHQEESKVNGILAPRSESDNTSLNADEDEEDEDDSEGDLTCNADDKPWKCSHCGKMYAYKSALEFHIRTHTGAKPFTCSNCGQKFSCKASLESHKRTHTGEKPFACAVCGQTFSQKVYLTCHTKTHTGEKPFDCAFCGQRFSEKASLKIHTRIHTGEKPFGCAVCGQKFSCKGYLKNHTRTHTSEKPFACAVCGQRFSWKHQIKNHKCDDETSSHH